MKVGIIADLHLNLFRKQNPFFIHVEKSINDFDILCKEKNVERIFIAGDFFHTKYSISTEALIRANNLLAKLSQTAPIIMIRGNHDTASLHELHLNLCENYKYFDKFEIINDYSKKEIQDTTFHFLAYADKKNLLNKIKKIKLNKKTKNILISHIAINGFKWHGEFRDYDSLVDKSLFKDFDFVFTGHFHGFQNEENIIYVSSPLQSKFGDECDKHGFVFYDTETNEYEFIQNTNPPFFITLDFIKENVKHALQLKDHYIRFIITKHISKELLNSIKQKLLENNFDVAYKYQINNDLLQFTSIENWDQIDLSNLDDLLKNFLSQMQIPSELSELSHEQLLSFILN